MNEPLIIGDDIYYKHDAPNVYVLCKESFLLACKEWLGIDDPDAIKELMREYKERNEAR